MINPVGEEIFLEQKVLNAPAGGIQHLAITSLEWLAGDLVGQIQNNTLAPL